MSEIRIEKDSLGEVSLNASAYYGIHTFRASQNFSISGRKTAPKLIYNLALVKRAACETNVELGFISPAIGDAIIQACDEVANGKLDQQFILDALQGGAGTSTNMNVNEVLANRALEILGKRKGDYDQIHPLEMVNLHQSTNDVFPTALKCAAISGFRTLSEKLAKLQAAFQDKEQAFATVVKIGRTEWQEAVPMTLGLEFGAFAAAFSRDRWRTFKCEERLRTINLGGTAIGTGLTAPKKYIFLVTDKLRQLTGLGLNRGEHCVDQTANADAFVEVSGILKALATNLIKVGRDLRHLHSLGEIQLAPTQAGSSIMPGKVNPVLCEAVIQAGIRAKAEDMVVAEAASMGSLQINEYMPLLADALLSSLELLCNGVETLTRCVTSLNANPEICQKRFEQSPTLMTALLPYLGYDKTQQLIEEFKSEDGSLLEFLTARLGEDVVRLFSAENLTKLGY